MKDHRALALQGRRAQPGLLGDWMSDGLLAAALLACAVGTHLLARSWSRPPCIAAALDRRFAALLPRVVGRTALHTSRAGCRCTDAGSGRECAQRAAEPMPRAKRIDPTGRATLPGSRPLRTRIGRRAEAT